MSWGPCSFDSTRGTGSDCPSQTPDLLLFSTPSGLPPPPLPPPLSLSLFLSRCLPVSHGGSRGEVGPVFESVMRVNVKKEESTTLALTLPRSVLSLPTLPPPPPPLTLALSLRRGGPVCEPVFGDSRDCPCK